MISQKAKYAFKALVVLARAGTGESVRTDQIARQAAVPRKFLEQILLQLKAHGLIDSRRGRTGGYVLVRRPEEITVSQVLRIVDGPIAPLACISRTAYRRCPDCADEAQCGVRRMFAETYSATLQMMEETTLADAFRGESLAASPADPVRTPPAQHGKLVPAE
jgi:Rrf2 family protein